MLSRNEQFSSAPQLLAASLAALASRYRHPRPLPLQLILLGLLASLAGDAGAQAYLPAIGGSGGGQFKAPCAASENLAGFELRAGDDVDAIRPVCVHSLGPIGTSAPALTSGSGLIPLGPFNPQALAPGWYGGIGGSIELLLCPPVTPIVIGINVAAEGVDNIVVNNIHLFCGQAAAAQTPAAYPSAIFDAPGYAPSPGWLGIGSPGKDARLTIGTQRCPAGQVAIGVHGRSGWGLDAIGLICDAPRLQRPAVQAVGRVKPATPPAVQVVGRIKPATPVTSVGSQRLTPPPTAAPDPRPPICDRARSARTRNSPAAPGLEAQCRAAGGTP